MGFLLIKRKLVARAERSINEMRFLSFPNQQTSRQAAERSCVPRECPSRASARPYPECVTRARDGASRRKWTRENARRRACRTRHQSAKRPLETLLFRGLGTR